MFRQDRQSSPPDPVVVQGLITKESYEPQAQEAQTASGVLGEYGARDRGFSSSASALVAEGLSR